MEMEKPDVVSIFTTVEQGTRYITDMLVILYIEGITSVSPPVTRSC